MIVDTKQKEGVIRKESTRTTTILFVDDEAPIRTFGSRVLSSNGYKILEAENGAEALKIVQEHGEEIDLIVTDTIMPIMTGPEFVMEAGKLYPKIKVLFISGYTEENFSSPIALNKQLNFLAKPFTLDLLMEKVKEVLGKN